MIVYKFGGATTRTARGLETLIELVRSAHQQEIQEARRRKHLAGDQRHGVIVVVSAIGHTTRSLRKAAELARDGQLHEAHESLSRVIQVHSQLASSLRLLPGARTYVEQASQKIERETLSLLEGIAITKELTPRVLDSVLSMGEALAIRMIEALLQERGLPIQVVDAREVITTDEHFGRAEPLMSEIQKRAEVKILPLVSRSQIVLIQGFVGATRDGRTTTMGSESSDLTATLLARVIGARTVTIWKSVPGIFTADPELVPGARLIKSLTFSEAEELGRRGARILHPHVAHPLKIPDNQATLQVASPKTSMRRSSSIQLAVKHTGHEKPLAVALEQNLTLLRVLGSANGRRVRPDRARQPELPMELILHHLGTPSEAVWIVRRDDKQRVLASSRHKHITEEKQLFAAVSLILRSEGHHVAASGIMSQFLKALKSFNPAAIVPVEHSIVALVDQSHALAALRRLHKQFFGS